MLGSVIGALRVNLGLDSAQFSRGVQQAEQSTERLKRQFRGIATGIGAAAAALGTITVATARTANEVTRLAQLANTTPQAFQRMAAGARTVGIEQDKLSDILKDTNDRIGDFLQTGGGEMADFFEKIAPQVGVTAEQFRNLAGPDALQLYVSSLERAGLNQAEMTYYMESLADEATALLPLLANSGAEMDRLAGRADALGAVMDERTRRSLNDMQVSLVGVGEAFAGVRNRIAGEMAPAMTALADAFTASMMEGGKLRAVTDVVIGSLDRLAAYATTAAIAIGARYAGAAFLAAARTLTLSTALVTLRRALIRTGFGALVVGAGELVHQFGRLASRSTSVEGIYQELSDTTSQLSTVSENLAIDYSDLERAKESLTDATRAGSEVDRQSAIVAVSAINDRIRANETLRRELAITQRSELNAMRAAQDSAESRYRAMTEQAAEALVAARNRARVSEIGIEAFTAEADGMRIVDDAAKLLADEGYAAVRSAYRDLLEQKARAGESLTNDQQAFFDLNRTIEEGRDRIDGLAQDLAALEKPAAIAAAHTNTLTLDVAGLVSASYAAVPSLAALRDEYGSLAIVAQAALSAQNEMALADFSSSYAAQVKSVHDLADGMIEAGHWTGALASALATAEDAGDLRGQARASYDLAVELANAAGGAEYLEGEARASYLALLDATLQAGALTGQMQRAHGWVDAVAGAAANAYRNLAAAGGGARQLAQGILGAYNAAGSLLGMLNSVARVLGQIGSGLVSFASRLPAVGEAVESVAGAAGALGGGVGALASRLGELSGINELAGRIRNAGVAMNGLLVETAGAAAAADIAAASLADLGGGGGGGGGGAMGAASDAARELERAQEDLKRSIEGVNEAVRRQREEWAELASGGIEALISGDFGSWWDGIRDQGTSAFADVVSTGLDQGFSAAMGSIGQSWGQLTSGLGGLFSGGGMASLGQAISGALPFIGMATTALQLLDSFSSTKIIGRGVSGTLGGAGGARASDYERERRTSFWGLMSSTSTDYRRNAGLSDLLAGEVRGVKEAIRDMTGAVGLAAGDLSGYVARFKFDTRGLSESEVQERLNRELRAYADVVAAGEMATTAFNRAGESNIDALERMSTAIRAVNPTLEQLGHHAFDVSLAGADAASHLAELMGGLDAFASATQTYFRAFYDDAERTAILTRDLGAQMAALNLAMPQSRAQFRAMVEAVDISTASGRALYAELIGLAGAFDQVLPAVANVTAAMQAVIGSTSGLIGSLIADVTERQRASDRAADLWLRTADTLRGLIAEMRGIAGALVSGAEARRFTEARYQSLLAATVAGDNAAASDLPKAAQAMLEATRATASSRAGLARAEARVLSDLQLASGVSDIEGARHQVLAGLLGDQVGLLEDMRDYLNAGGVLEASQLAAFEASLASLGGAIEAVKSITYADISARLDVVLTATDDMAPWMRQALGNAVSGITVDVDYIVRADGLTPDLRWLALAGASEHVKTVEFLAANRMGPELTGLALDRAADIARTVSFTIGSRLPADLTRLALAGSSELTRTVNAALASGVDARALRLALGNVGAYEVAVRAALDPGVSGEVRRIVFADAGTYAVTVQAALSASMDPAARRALLEAQGEVAVNIVGTLGPGTTPAEKLLLLNANTAALRGITVAMAFPSSVTAAERALLLESSTSAIRAITALVNPLRVTPDELLFLRELSETGVVQRALEGTVWTRDMGWTDQAILTQLGLGHGVVQRALAARVELHTMGWTDSAILAQLSAGAGSVRRTVDSKMFAEAGSWTRHALLTQLVEGDGAVRRSVQGQMFATAGTWARNTLLAQLAAGDGGVRRNVDGRMFANTGTWARDAVLAQLAAGEGSIRRILAGEVDVSALTGPQRALLEALASGSAAGTLTLGGTFRFDPSAAFGTALESGFKAPSEQLRGALDQLRGAILANSAATADASVAARVNSIAGGLLHNDKGQTILTDAGLADLATRLGVSQEGGVYATAARIAGLSATDSISSILRDKSGYQTRQALMQYLDSPGLKVKPAGYVAAYDDTAKFTPGAQEHFERHGLKEILSGSRTLDPDAFDWSSIGLNIPGFAAGGWHEGGWRVAGEYGPELAYTPPQRIHSAPQSRSLMDTSGIERRLDALVAQVDHLRDENAAQARVIAYEAKRSADLAQRSEDIGQPAVRTEGA